MCLNFTGIYFRLLNEVTTRRTFLDRRECVEGNLLLKYERNQEKELLLSILPEHTTGVLEKDIRKLIKQIRTDRNKKSNDRNSKE
jgi:adenylate cyclase